MYWMLLPLKRYADFRGRSRRKELWMFVLGYVLIFAVLGTILGTLGAFSLLQEDAPSQDVNGPMLGVFGILGLIGLGLFIPSLAVQVRRLHDRDMSGWWLLLFYVLSLVPLVGFFVWVAQIVLMILPGTPGPNRFGPDPKDPYGRLDDTDVFA
ncbi:hypothetical protein ASG37_12330 [Sphingomonas sp. Leaf407]|uniref:DUF805 domain-containing protein n=1 Tax=unclassified Sphingomonas TaxID=196159 RepID=UPI0006FF519A|nr:MULTISPECIES: DUF805 domain-containing protein [unclassified Sphingomonas]KQN37785.1 hypothetical protein ASE97_09620 [Sphingomonas sp. Leaf42]KQT28152.1 hypothetical protein ASG37_12330 [Sphingomonas sp. Leaf407]